MADLKQLSKADLAKLGKSGKCDDCGRPGTYTLDPVAEKEEDKAVVVCLCANCEAKRS